MQSAWSILLRDKSQVFSFHYITCIVNLSPSFLSQIVYDCKRYFKSCQSLSSSGSTKELIHRHGQDEVFT